MNTSLRGLQEKWKKKKKELRKDRNGRIRGSQPLRSETEKYSIPRRLTCSSSVPHIGWLQKLFSKVVMTERDELPGLALLLPTILTLWTFIPEDREAPSTLMWALFLLAQHSDKGGQYDLSLSKIDEAIERTPTVIDLYSTKSQILKHAGDLAAAAALEDEGRRRSSFNSYVALFLLAQHSDKGGQYDLNLSKIDEAIEHTPTLIDLYSAKCRILKHDGYLAAAALADET